MKRWLCLGLWLVLAPPLAGAEPSVPFVVIVNAENPVKATHRSVVSSLFLKRLGAWENGVKSRPVDLSESSPIREAFSRQILGRHTGDVEHYWQTVIFSGREIPPPKKVSDAEVMQFVARYPGGIGYVSPSTPLTAGIRILHLEE